MAPDALQIILDRLDRLEHNQRDDLAGLHDKLNALTAHGCAQLPAMAAVSHDHETRIRVAERYINRQAGMATAIGGVAGVAGGMLAWIGRVVLHRINAGS